MKTKLCLTLLHLSLFCLGCADQSFDVSSSIDQKSEREVFKWMEDRVDLILQHKSDCSAMAEALIKHHITTQDQVARWKALGADRWLRREAGERSRAELTPTSERYGVNSIKHGSLDKELTHLITRGDLIYYHCASQVWFQGRLRSGIKR